MEENCSEFVSAVRILEKIPRFQGMADPSFNGPVDGYQAGFRIWFRSQTSAVTIAITGISSFHRTAAVTEPSPGGTLVDHIGFLLT